ncbi:cytochrome-c peroxidase [Hymenobacter cheonanensis]|uniref:cytochrome-c peroxidase n=1 Tax=Hymenobacter sp. CA2-7 TaxID=3063993 RepID=UPI0027132C92|nr:cytochrome c peroxidase [Hymenobacter sp. CA2-7]MDO7885639.1 cytochrome c peroxidase [Hymenobacter sp. CA2-7]
MAANSTAQLTSLLASALLLVAAAACQKQATSPFPNNLAALPLAALAPADNPSSPAKVELGRALFWDPILSGGKDVSCASCHHPATGYADALDLAIGENGRGLGTARHFQAPNTIPFGQRNTQTVLNTAYNGLTTNGSVDPALASMFWDSRAQSLETQALRPLSTLEEMRGHAYAEGLALDSAVARLRRVPAYTTLFQAAFGGTQPITATTLSQALACFERSLVATDSPFDQYMRGTTSALSAEQVQGMQAFVQSGCANCHSGPMLSDYQLHVMGVADNPKNAASDTGANGTYAFRTPSLRNVALTAPYMHSGTVPNLAGVLDFYDPGPGGSRSANPHVATNQRDAQFPTRVTNKQAIIAFLNSLTASSYDRTVPAKVPSGLPVGGNIN